jgi:hypothetical protein
MLFGLDGKLLAQVGIEGSPGHHLFHVNPGHQNILLIMVSDGQYCQTLKAVGSGIWGSGQANLRYQGLAPEPEMKKEWMTISPFNYEPGDEFQLIGLANGYVNSTILDSPIGDSAYVFHLHPDNGIPCPGSISITITDYDNNIYNTVQTGSQCWMKENMRATHYSDGIPIPLVNDSTAWGNLSPTDKAIDVTIILFQLEPCMEPCTLGPLP